MEELAADIIRVSHPAPVDRFRGCQSCTLTTPASAKKTMNNRLKKLHPSDPDVTKALKNALKNGV